MIMKNILVLALILNVMLLLPAAEKKDEKQPIMLQLEQKYPASDNEAGELVYFKMTPILDVDFQGNVFAFDPRSHHFIYKLGPDSKCKLKVGTRGVGPGDLYMPVLMKVDNNKVIVRDQTAWSIFDLNGKFLSRFRTFNSIIAFDAHKDKIYMVENFNEAKGYDKNRKFFTVYSLDGKKLESFGEPPYVPNYSLYKKEPASSIYSDAHVGKIICTDNCIFFISERFGEIYKYDYKGKLITKGQLPDLDNKDIRKNRKTFFDGSYKDSNYDYIGSWFDASYCNGRLYILKQVNVRRMNYEIMEIDPNTFNMLNKYDYYKINPNNGALLLGLKLVVKEINSVTRFYLSLKDEKDEDFFIQSYRIKDGQKTK